MINVQVVQVIPLLLLIALLLENVDTPSPPFPYQQNIHFLIQRLGYNNKNNACTYPGLYIFIVSFDDHNKLLKGI